MRLRNLLLICQSIYIFCNPVINPASDVIFVFLFNGHTDPSYLFVLFQHQLRLNFRDKFFVLELVHSRPTCRRLVENMADYAFDINELVNMLHQISVSSHHERIRLLIIRDIVRQNLQGYHPNLLYLILLVELVHTDSFV
jgi:hypothetical protein